MKIIKTLVLLSLTLNLSAQTPNYFANDPEWRLSSGCVDETPCVEEEEYVYYTFGDSTINNVSYKKIFKHGTYAKNWYDSPPVPSWCDTSMTFDFFITLVRQENKKIFIHHENEPEELLYDFELKVGDTLPLTWNQFNEEIIVTSIDSLQVGNEYRRIFNLTNQYPSELIEGIGHNGGFLEPFQTSLDCGFQLKCFALNDTTYYPNFNAPCDLTVSIKPTLSQETFKYYPNPVTTELSIEKDFSESIEQVISYNTIGQKKVLSFRQVGENMIIIDCSGLGKGIYLIQVIENGKPTLNLKVLKD